MIQSIRIPEVFNFVDAARIVVEKNLTGAHSNLVRPVHHADEFVQPPGIRFGVVIERRREFPCTSDAGVAPAGEPRFTGSSTSFSSALTTDRRNATESSEEPSLASE